MSGPTPTPAPVAPATVSAAPPAATVEGTAVTMVEPTPAEVQAPADLELSIHALLILLYPLLLLVGIRLLRISLRRIRTWIRRSTLRFEEWLKGAGASAARAREARLGLDVASRLGELIVYLIFIYAATIYFFVLFPQTRELGLGLATLAWTPVRQTLVTALRVCAYAGTIVVVMALAQRGISYVRNRLGVGPRLPLSAGERERQIVVRAATAIVWFVALITVLIILPGAAQLVGLALVIVGMLAALLAFRETFEDLIAGLAAGRLYDLPPGARVRVGGVEGTIVAWGLLDLRLETASGDTAFVPYRALQSQVLVVLGSNRSQDEG